jgi:UDP-N-acetylmuramate--alanine ligase
MKPFPGFKRAHFVGIGGAGMSCMAEVLASNGFEISGSDMALTSVTNHLSSLGIEVIHGHENYDVSATDVVVYSSAIPEDNPELQASRASGIPVVRRAELLGEIMKKKWTLAVSGTHGKTTTTFMLGSIWAGAGIDPTVMGGGIQRGRASGTRVGQGPYLIVEADEYDRSFLSMYPTVVLITNIDGDHLDCYGTMENIKEAFVEFARKVPFYGFVVANLDDPEVCSILPKLDRRLISYGCSPDAEYRMGDVITGRDGCRFTVYRKGIRIASIKLKVLGRHNASNALGAFALSHALAVPEATIQAGLEEYEGAGRRMEFLGEAGGISFFDDYAHHPSEVRVTLEAVRNAYAKRIVIIFQPHLYSRTRMLSEDFANVLSDCDLLFVLPIYAAREKPIHGVEGSLIAEAARRKGHPRTQYLADTAGAAAHILKALKPGDLVMTMGAGDVWELGRELMDMADKHV